MAGGSAYNCIRRACGLHGLENVTPNVLIPFGAAGGLPGLMVTRAFRPAQRGPFRQMKELRAELRLEIREDLLIMGSKGVRAARP